jgi:glycogen synthase
MPKTARGRVVMLVDNDVERDSRVQKQARSMAEAGWDVTLLGKAGPGGARRWMIGEAKVRLLPTPGFLVRRPGDLRRARLRSPLAYSAGWLADNRRQAVRAKRAELRLRLIATRNPAEGEKARPAEKLRLLPARASTAVLGTWVDLRARRTANLVRTRQEADRPVDQVTTRFWEKAMGDRAWRRLDPHLWDFELAYGPELDRLRPDVIHANDFRMLGVGARAVIRAREQGRDVKLVWDAHEFLPGIKPWESHPRWHIAQVAHEREYAPAADAVVTVSHELAELLQETHDLPELPTVVLNTPYAAEAEADPHQPTIRDALGLGPDVPVMVYSGSAAPQRGLDIMVEALPQLPGVVCALVVAKPEADYVRSLLARARELGVSDRVRLLPYVPFDQVVPFLSTADAGVIPIHHWPNHEIALITKFFEYSHARLPIVVSDVEAMAHMTRQTGQGEVFEAENLASFVTAVQAVVENPQRYRKAYDDPALLGQWTWEAQAAILDGVYQKLLDNRTPGRT